MRRVRDCLRYSRKLGLPLPQKPGVKPEAEGDITRLPPRRVSSLHVLYTAWLGYCNVALAKTSIQLLESERILRRAQAMFRLRSSEKTKWRLDDRMRLDCGIERLAIRVQRFEARKIFLESLSSTYEGVAKAISRELSRRLCEFDQASRT